MFLFALVEHDFSIFDFVANIFRNNLINWLLLVGAIYFLMQKFLPGLLASRKQSIEGALKDAAQAKSEGEAFFAAQKRKVALADQEMQSIIVEANQIAKDMKKQIEEQTTKELANLKDKIEQDIANERRLAILQLRTAAASAAVALTEATLASSMSESAQKKLLDQFIEELDVDQGKKLELSHK